jgi:hypothetical protein
MQSIIKNKSNINAVTVNNTKCILGAFWFCVPKPIPTPPYKKIYIYTTRMIFFINVDRKKSSFFIFIRRQANGIARALACAALSHTFHVIFDVIPSCITTIINHKYSHIILSKILWSFSLYSPPKSFPSSNMFKMMSINFCIYF